MRFIQEYSNKGWRVEKLNGEVVGNVRKYYAKGRITERWEAIKDGKILMDNFQTRKSAVDYLLNLDD